MPTEQYAGLTGDGIQTFTNAFLSFGLTVQVTNIGGAVPLDLGAQPRYLHIGWWALVDIDQYPAIGITGNTHHSYHFIDFDNQYWESVLLPDASTGATGFRYHLDTGVECTFTWYY